MYNLTLSTPLSLFISLAALTGVAVHDTKIDRFATAFAGIPAMMTTAEGASKGIASDPHTHVERVSINDMNSSQPRLMPRADQKKHFLQKNVPKGFHRFDSYNLPIV
ncbi:MAG TPA: hypothetical protein PK096_01520 [Candidatus Saccharibacteria bacterium]|nr:hypothetical protein [Candidatus Saccharibacteria bacterium]HRK94025.1 hypothetical protein [Candidatus Saccharibacteria bacterium]